MSRRINTSQVQKQIKAFNKFMSRNDVTISDLGYESITDLIIGNAANSRMTKSGYAKAGIKYLESLSPKELAAYSADIQDARNTIELLRSTKNILSDADVLGDPVSALWKTYDALQDLGQEFDSEQVRDIATGANKKDYKQTIINMLKTLDSKYGLADWDVWYHSNEGLRE